MEIESYEGDPNIENDIKLCSAVNQAYKDIATVKSLTKSVIYLDCSNTEILGVFGKGIYLLTHGYLEDDTREDDFECILIIPEKVYFAEWKKWIQGKREYCERFNHYCGVMGIIHPDNPELIGKQKIIKWNSDKREEEEVEVLVYKADKFTGIPDFEHG